MDKLGSKHRWRIGPVQHKGWIMEAMKVSYSDLPSRENLLWVYVVTTSAANPVGFITALTWRPCSSWTLASQWSSTAGMTELGHSYPKDNFFNGTLLLWPEYDFFPTALLCKAVPTKSSFLPSAFQCQTCIMVWGTPLPTSAPSPLLSFTGTSFHQSLAHISLSGLLTRGLELHQKHSTSVILYKENLRRSGFRTTRTSKSHGDY